jgi:uncharacterized protein
VSNRRESEPPIFVAACDLGLGVFARRDLDAGETIFRFSGPVITLEESVAPGRRSMNDLQIAPRLYLDLEPPGLYLNHSCEPNAGVRDDLFLIALRAIAGGEELRFDYSTTMGETYESMICGCGSERCRGVVGDFADLPESLRQTYLEAGIVQSFLRAPVSGFDREWVMRGNDGARARSGRRGPSVT